MTALTTSRDALAKAIWEASRADEGTISATGANHVADALIASGAVVDAATLADDEILRHRMTRWLYAAYDEFPERSWEDESERARESWGRDGRDLLRALAAALSERGQA